MKYHVMRLSAVMLVAGCFFTMRPAQEPVRNVAKDIKNMSAAANCSARFAEDADQKYIAQHTVACPFCGLRAEYYGCNRVICGGDAHIMTFLSDQGCHRCFCLLCLHELVVSNRQCPNGCPLFGGKPRCPVQANRQSH